MQDAHSVITHAAHGHVEELANAREVSLRRMYEILGKDNPYPKAKVLIRDIARVNPDGARMIKADLEAMFVDILGDDYREISDVELHKEAFDVIDASLRGKCAADQKRELRELISVCQLKIEGLERFESRNGLKTA